MPQSGENVWKMKFFPGQGKVREFCGWPGKFRKDLESQGKVREFENKWLWQGVFRKFIYSVQQGKGCTFPEIVLNHFLLFEKSPKGKNFAPLGSKSFPLRVLPKFEVIQLTLLK